MKLYIGDLKLGEIPLIAGVLTDADIPLIDRNSLNTVDLIEFRVDMFENILQNEVENIFRHASENFKKPIIATVRDVNEGGEREVADRLSIYRAVVPLSDVIDVEISSDDILREAKKLCSDRKKLLIGSYHNFESTPDNAFLDDIISKGKSLGADIVKIAVMPENRDDLIRLLNFTLKHKDKGIISMSMGDAGLPSRAFAPVFGSLITYGYINRPSAPGQLSVSELMDIFRRLKLR